MIANGAAPLCDVDLMRQRVIVQLLRESSMHRDELSAILIECILNGVLSKDLAGEVRSLVRDKGCSDLSTTNDLQIYGPFRNVNALRAPPSHGKPSHFGEQFECIELLGQGAFGKVWRARNHVDKIEHAVKEVRFQYLQGESPYAHRALREAETWTQVQHPNVVRYRCAWVEVEDHVEEGSDDTALPHTKGLLPSVGAPIFDELSAGSGLTFTDASDSGGIVFEESPDKEASEGLDEIQLLPERSARRKAQPKQWARLYVQTELVRGGTLLQWIQRRNKALAPGSEIGEAKQFEWLRQAETIFRQLVSAISAVHAKGIAHRDIKPENVLLDDGDVKLADFGLAKSMMDNTSQLHQLEAGDASHVIVSEAGGTHTQGLGTPSYASPEQMNNGMYDVKSDIYSLGMVLAELLVPVQTHMERAALFEGLVQRKLPPQAALLCPDVGPLVLAMVCSDPGDRPSASEIASCLAGIAGCQSPQGGWQCAQGHTAIEDGDNREEMTCTAPVG